MELSIGDRVQVNNTGKEGTLIAILKIGTPSHLVEMDDVNFKGHNGFPGDYELLKGDIPNDKSTKRYYYIKEQLILIKPKEQEFNIWN